MGKDKTPKEPKARTMPLDVLKKKRDNLSRLIAEREKSDEKPKSKGWLERLLS